MKSKFIGRVVFVCLMLFTAAGGGKATVVLDRQTVDDKKSKQSLNAALIVRANLYFGRQDEEILPMPDTPFYLLTKSAAEVLRENALKVEIAGDYGGVKDNVPLSDELYLETAARAYLPNAAGEDGEKIRAVVRFALSRYNKGKLTTDVFGNGDLKNIQPGKYYLYGMTQASDEVIVWNVPVTIKRGANQLTVDQYNAEAVFSVGDNRDEKLFMFSAIN